MLTLFRRLGDIGIKSYYLPWERYITRNLNYITVASTVAIFSGLATYWLAGYYTLVKVHLVALVFLPLIIAAVVFLNYKWGLYAFYSIILSLMMLFTVKMGEASLSYLFLVPLTISLLMLMRRKEMRKNTVVLFIILLGFFVLGIVCNISGCFDSSLPARELGLVRGINILFSSAMTFTVTGIIVQQNSRMANELNTLLKDKEILLAEVNHRVKNNMNIITSLLNLEKERALSADAREALENSRNRVFSMALIQQKVFGSKSVKYVNFQEYITELAEEMVSSYSLDNVCELDIHADDCLLGLDVAVPCGLIINEVLTNSLKHAVRKDAVLQLIISMKKISNTIEIVMSDNGPGMADIGLTKKESLGMSLIDMLCKQLDADYNFSNNNGLVFHMSFQLPK